MKVIKDYVQHNISAIYISHILGKKTNIGADVMSTFVPCAHR